MSSKPPTDVLKDGNLKASIWENVGQKGPYFTTTLAKVYQDRDGNLRDTNVFNNSDLLKVSELARQAYGRTNELRQDRLRGNEAERTPGRMQEQTPDRTQEGTPAHEAERIDDRQSRAEAYLKGQRESAAQSRDPEMER